jgi:hypothetical protein
MLERRENIALTVVGQDNTEHQTIYAYLLSSTPVSKSN